MQVQIMHDLRSGDAAPRSAGGRPAAASESTVDNGPCMQSAAPPAGQDHFLQANRMRMNCTHAVEYGLFSEKRARPVRKVRAELASEWHVLDSTDRPRTLFRSAHHWPGNVPNACGAV